jgi:hypothetical protein
MELALGAELHRLEQMEALLLVGMEVMEPHLP